MKSYDKESNLYMLEALRILETMIELGFYTSEKELIDVTSPLVGILSGVTDYYSVQEEEEHEQQIKADGEDKPLRKTTEQNKIRYQDSEENRVMMDIKNKIIDIFSKLVQFQSNQRLTKFLILFCKMDGKKERKLMKYYDLQMKIQTSNNPKHYEKDLNSSATKDV